MKLIIDIPEREYKVICENNYVAVCACPNLLSNAIKNGTPIPDNVPTVDVLDKIRDEMDVARFIDKDTKLCKNANASGLEVAMQIIDKYR